MSLDNKIHIIHK